VKDQQWRHVQAVKDGLTDSSLVGICMPFLLTGEAVSTDRKAAQEYHDTLRKSLIVGAALLSLCLM
jgi:hypothetical protein